jgi:hypothetical protein
VAAAGNVSMECPGATVVPGTGGGGLRLLPRLAVIPGF